MTKIYLKTISLSVGIAALWSLNACQREVTPYHSGPVGPAEPVFDKGENRPPQEPEKEAERAGRIDKGADNDSHFDD